MAKPSNFQPLYDIEKAAREILSQASDEQLEACYWEQYEDFDNPVRAAISREIDNREAGIKQVIDG